MSCDSACILVQLFRILAKNEVAGSLHDAKYPNNKYIESVW